MKLIKVFRTLWRATIGGDPEARSHLWRHLRFRIALHCARWLDPGFPPTRFGTVWMDDLPFREWYSRCHGRDERYLDRCHTLGQLARAALAVPGDTAECGVFQGATSHLICTAIAGTGREHHGFDSFAGLSEPLPIDGPFWAKGWLTAPEHLARQRLQEFPFARLYPGWIPTRFGEVADRRFCLVHLDVDLYQPTLEALEFFWPRLNPGGYLVCDDYGIETCPGARQALDGFFANRPERVVLLTTGQGLVVRSAGG